MSKFHVELGSIYAPGWHVYEEVGERHFRSRICCEDKADAEEFLAYLQAEEVTSPGNL